MATQHGRIVPGAPRAKRRSPRRWHFQFSLRSLCLATLFSMAVVNAVRQHVQEGREELRSAKILTEAGACIVFDAEESLQHASAKARRIEWVQNLTVQWRPPRVVAADLCGVELTDERLQMVTRFSHLQSLHLVGNDVTDQSLDKLWRLKRLRRLTLNGTRATQSGVARLKSRSPCLAVNWRPEPEAGK